jgi:hypothetical protein
MAMLAHRQQFVARLVLAELLAKRSAGPLQRKVLVYSKKR